MNNQMPQDTEVLTGQELTLVIATDIINILDLNKIISMALNLAVQKYKGNVIDFTQQYSFLIWLVYHEAHKMFLSWFPLSSMNFC